MSDRGPRLEELFACFVETLVVEGRRLAPEQLCAGDPDLLAPLRDCIARYEEVDEILSTRRRLRPGRRLGRYAIAEELGRGGMGFVYRAQDTATGRDVALKLFPPENMGEIELRSRFEREARVIEMLDHPNIVKFLSLEDEAGLAFLTMELVDGNSLAERVPPGGLQVPEALALARPLAAALACMHEHGVLHRDLKPSNVMVTSAGTLKVLDFGLARFHREDALSLTETGRVLGTVCYMAPEQLLGSDLDARSDIFSFGAVLYEMLSGQPPFRGQTASEVVEAVLHGEPEMGALQAGSLRDLVVSCLRKNREERPRSAVELGRQLLPTSS